MSSFGWHYPPGCDYHPRRSTDDAECARCGRHFEHEYINEMGGRVDDGYTCPSCDYHEDDALPGAGYCTVCWANGSGAVLLDTSREHPEEWCAMCRDGDVYAPMVAADRVPGLAGICFGPRDISAADALTLAAALVADKEGA